MKALPRKLARAICRSPYSSSLRRKLAEWLWANGERAAAARQYLVAHRLEKQRDRLVLDNQGLVGGADQTSVHTVICPHARL